MSDAVLEWTFEPWRDRPRAAATAALAVLALCALLLTFPDALLVRIVWCLIVIGALAPVLAPARCRLDDEGLARRGPFGTTRRRWSEIRRAERRPAGLLVSPYPRPHWLDAYRGLLLPLPRPPRGPRPAELRERLAAHGL